MRHSLQSRLSFVAAALALATAAACSQAPTGQDEFGTRAGGNGGSGGGNGETGSASGSGGGPSGSQGNGGGSGSGSGGGGSGVTVLPDGGVVVSSTDAGGPPPSQPAQPNGFQDTIAPLLDAQGCTECHHHGRPIDLTTYPFMAGTAAAAAQQLVASFTKDMPPSPRTTAPQTVIDQVNAWVAAGMKP